MAASVRETRAVHKSLIEN